MQENDDKPSTLRKAGLLFGPLIFLVMMFIPAPEVLDGTAWKVMALFAWMLTWWITEAVPIPVTSLLPLVMLPLLNVSPIAEAAAPYSSPVIFLFLGGFLLALAIEKWNLHERISLGIIKLIGNGADSIIAGFMIATALLSMWISNTATAVMMLPIALAVIHIMFNGKQFSEMKKGEQNFSISLLLSIAYSASIGGTATLVGTPPNAVLAGLTEKYYNVSLDFSKWMLIGVPYMLILLGVTWLLLVKVFFSNNIKKFTNAEKLVENKYFELGKISFAEKMTLAVFGITVFCWIFKIQINKLLPSGSLTDHGIAVLGGLLLFIAPSGKGTPLLRWKDTLKLPWGILLLFGGGLTMAAALEKAGIISLIGEYIAGSSHLHLFVLISLLTFASLSLTEVMSNVALVTVFVPVVFGISNGLGIPPMILAIPVTLASSCAFTMPISTPPNAVIFSSGYIKLQHMFKAGILLNIIAIILTVLFGYFLVKAVF